MDYLGTLDENVCKGDYVEFVDESIRLKYRIDESYYNTGVIGISYKQRNIIRQILKDMDNILSATNYFGADDLATSHNFQIHKNKIIITYDYFIHYFTNDEIRLYYAYVTDVYFSNEKSELEKYLNKMGLSHDTMKLLDINEQNYKYYVFLLVSYRKHRHLIDLNDLLLQAIVEGYVLNRAEEKELFIQFFKKFETVIEGI